jgi:hypothetical protein
VTVNPEASFDVVLVGAQLPNLVAAALLAKRGFRLLVLPQDEHPALYTPVEGLALPRAPFTLSCGRRPVATRIVRELALQQVFHRVARSPDPAFQVALPGKRFDLCPAPELFASELDREFPDVRRFLEDFHRLLGEDDAALDAALESISLPPRHFLDRRQLQRAAADLPFDPRHGDGGDRLATLPDDHPFRRAVALPARFEDGMDPDHPTPLRRQRAFTAWLDASVAIEGGYAALRQLLERAIQTHGGEVRERERVSRIETRRGVAVGVRLAASGEVLGAGHVLVGSPLGHLLTLLPDRTPFEELFERIGEPVVRHYRYTLQLVLAREGVPVGMARTVFLGLGGRSDLGSLHLESEALDAERHRLTVEALVPRRGVEEVPGYVEGLRERLLVAVRELVPFLDEHLLWVDSPHDGLPPFDARGGAYEAPLNPWERGPHTMRGVYAYPVPSAFGVCALPVVSPIRRLLLCNGQVIPGLGLEGELRTALSAADVVTRADTQGPRVRRSRWGSILGP